LYPDLTFYVDVTVEEGLRRRQAGHAAGEELNRMDRQTREFYERVRAGYGELIKQDPKRWVYVDGMQSVEAVQDELRERMNAVLSGSRS
jgi:dTMP kinase